MNRLIPVMMTALVLVGCGQTGPLYMPDDQESRERYDPQGDYQTSDTQQGDAWQSDSQQSDPSDRNMDASENRSAVSVPEDDSSPVTPTGGTVGGAASTGAPTGPAAAGQGGT